MNDIFTPTPEMQVSPSASTTGDITQLEGGNYVLTWSDFVYLPDSSYVTKLYSQMFNAAGEAVSAAVLIGSPDTEAYTFDDAAQVLAMDDGGYVVTWRHQDSHLSVMAQRFDSAGHHVSFTKGGSDTGSVTVMIGNVDLPAATVLADGSFVISALDGSDNSRPLVRYDADGNHLQTKVFAMEGHYNSGAVLTPLSDGSYLFTSNTISSGARSDVLVEHHAADGTLIGDPILIVTQARDFNDPTPTIAAFDGGYIVAWESGDGDYHGIYAQRFSNDGTRLGDEFLVNTLTYGFQRGASVATLADGSMVIAWTSSDQDGHVRTYYQQYDAVGSRMGGQTQIGEEMYQGNVHIEALAGGGFVAAWLGSAGGDSSFYARQFALAGAGTGGNDTLTGGTGDEALHGLAGRDLLNGLAGNDILDGGTGFDTLVGAAGDDTYVIDDAHDSVTELAGDGTDTVQTSVTLTLAANVEKLVLTGTGNISGTGNGLNNSLTGNVGDNLLRGGDGNDVLDGGLGADTLLGNLGDDTYIANDANDLIREFDGEGNDTVIASVSFALGGAYVETLTLAGTGDIDAAGNALANSLNGNAGNNHLDGGAGSDTMSGGDGNDTYSVDSNGDVVVENSNAGIDLVLSSVNLTLAANVENLTLTGTTGISGFGNGLDNMLSGNSGNNLFNGGAGNDLIDGGAGADTMLGNLGDDTFMVGDSADLVREFSGQGTDTVFASVSYALGVAYVEDLTLTGSANIDATGNNVDNRLTGNNGANSLDAGAGNDTLDGGAGNDILTGSSGSDTFIFGLNSGVDVITDFAIYADTLDLHALSGGVAFGGGITLTQSGTDTVVDLGGGNTITLNNVVATNAALLTHIVW